MSKFVDLSQTFENGIVENLTHLEQLHGHPFRFFAVPIKGRQVAAMTIRAFAELL